MARIEEINKQKRMAKSGFKPTLSANNFMLKKKHKKMTQAEDDAYDKAHNQKEGSAKDIAQDKRNGIKDKKYKKSMKHKSLGKIKMSGKFKGKSNKLGQGGRAAQLKARGVPGGVIGNLARAAQAAPGQKNFHKKMKNC